MCSEYRKVKEGCDYDGIGHPGEAMAKQIGGNHYKGKRFQVWDIVDEYELDYYRGNVIKYVLRNKMDIYEDMEKAKHYIEKWLELNQGLQRTQTVEESK